MVARLGGALRLMQLRSTSRLALLAWCNGVHAVCRPSNSFLVFLGRHWEVAECAHSWISKLI